MVVICSVLFSFWCFWFTGMHRIIDERKKTLFSNGNFLLGPFNEAQWKFFFFLKLCLFNIASKYCKVFKLFSFSDPIVNVRRQ